MVPIHIIGHVCVDLTPELHSDRLGAPGELTEVGPLEVRTGGTLSNCARAVAALGAEVYLSGMVGDDDLGLICRNRLEAEHPGHVELRSHANASTSYSIVLSPPSRDRTFWHHTGANDEFRGECTIRPRSIVHFGYPTLCPGMCEKDGEPLVELFRRARDLGCATSLDLAYLADNSPLKAISWDALFANALPLTNIFCPSWDDIASCLPDIDPAFDESRIEEQARRFIDQGAGMVLITVGKHGAYLATGSEERLSALAELTGIDAASWANRSIWEEAVPVEKSSDRPLDTNGAGDTFKAAFLVALTREAAPEQAIRFASTVVARKLIRLPLDIAMEEI